jgi:hypothetical protein
MSSRAGLPLPSAGGTLTKFVRRIVPRYLRIGCTHFRLSFRCLCSCVGRHRSSFASLCRCCVVLCVRLRCANCSFGRSQYGTVRSCVLCVSLLRVCIRMRSTQCLLYLNHPERTHRWHALQTNQVSVRVVVCSGCIQRRSLDTDVRRLRVAHVASRRADQQAAAHDASALGTPSVRISFVASCVCVGGGGGGGCVFAVFLTNSIIVR